MRNRITESDFKIAVQASIVAAKSYGVAVVFENLPTEFNGDLTGDTIILNSNDTYETQLFTIAHLFGHTVQWNLTERARELGKQVYVNPPAALIPELIAYEFEAAGYGQQLLQEAGVEKLDQWYANYSHCDVAYLTHYYRTGTMKLFRSFWKEQADIINPIVIPEFTPQFWRSRLEGGLVI